MSPHKRGPKTKTKKKHIEFLLDHIFDEKCIFCRTIKTWPISQLMLELGADTKAEAIWDLNQSYGFSKGTEMVSAESFAECISKWGDELPTANLINSIRQQVFLIRADP